MNTLLIFICGFAAGMAVLSFSKFIKNKPVRVKEPDVIDPSKMEEISDFDEREFTKIYFEKAMHSIQSEDDWRVNVDNSEIKFNKSIRSDDKTQSVIITTRYDFDKDSKKFKLRDTITVEGNNGTYGSDYRIYGEPSTEVKSFMYKKYMDWKNEVNEKKKQEVSKKLESFKGILGKSVDRDMKLDQLLGN